MAHRHIPHSTKWFEALIRDDLEKAAHTAQVLSLSKRDDVCGVCGNDPASDFELPNGRMVDGSTPTMRFCSDCWTVRRGLGEDWEPMPGQ